MAKVVKRYELLVEVEVPSFLLDTSSDVERRAKAKFDRIEDGIRRNIDWENGVLLKEYSSTDRREEPAYSTPRDDDDDVEAVSDAAVALGALLGLGAIGGAVAAAGARDKYRERRDKKRADEQKS